jgi:single stranded DNA-binding protein
MKGLECAYIGVVGKTPELRMSRNEKSYTSFSVGVQTGHQDDAGRDDLQWVRTTCFGEVAERIAASVIKGDKVYCEGSLCLERWTTSDGQDRADLNCAAWKVEKLGQIGKNKPRKTDWQAPVKPRPSSGFAFNDEIGF